MDRIESFVASLRSYHSDTAFNPWADYDAIYDCGPQAPEIRAANLIQYLRLRQEARYILLAEALGYQGGHFTGIAMTSERILLGQHPTLSCASVLGTLPGQRTSNGAAPGLSVSQRTQGFNEPTATIVWGESFKCGLAPCQVVLWNIFPFHPYKEGKLLTNRTPTEAELRVGLSYFRALKELLPQAIVIAIGQKSASTLERAGIKAQKVRHPSMGGAAQFKAEIEKLWKC